MPLTGRHVTPLHIVITEAAMLRFASTKARLLAFHACHAERHATTPRAALNIRHITIIFHTLCLLFRALQAASAVDIQDSPHRLTTDMSPTSQERLPQCLRTKYVTAIMPSPSYVRTQYVVPYVMPLRHIRCYAIRVLRLAECHARY